MDNRVLILWQREDIYKKFRFTPYATRRVLLWGVGVPALTLYVLYDHMVCILILSPCPNDPLTLRNLTVQVGL
jgi:hypothetical protein